MEIDVKYDKEGLYFYRGMTRVGFVSVELIEDASLSILIKILSKFQDKYGSAPEHKATNEE